MDPATLAQQITDIIVPALPIIYAGGKVVTDKGKDMLVEGGKAVINKSKDMILERCIEKLGSKGGEKAKILFDKISSKKGEKLEKALINVSKNSEDPKAKRELQQEILKLLEENPNFAKEIEHIVINIENVDQLAVGNDNSFFNFKTNSGNQYIQVIKCPYEKDKETPNLNKPRHYNSSTLPEYSKRLKQFVDENRSEEIKKALTYIEEHKILLISGVGGVGKSTLARALVDNRPENIPEPFWFDFNLNQSAKLRDILEKLASYLEAPEISSFKNERREPGKYDIDKLTDELQRRDQVWLFFEDLSTVLEDRQFSNNEIELLFYTLRYNSHNAKIIITSRILPVFENGEDLLDKTEEEKFYLNGLKMNFAVEYLSSNGLNEVEAEKLEELARNVDGHPLALKLLVKVVKEYGIKDTLKDLSRYQEEKKDIILKARKLFDKLVGDEKELLECISVYRKPVGINGIHTMFKGNTPKKAVQKLMDKSLLETDHYGNYWLHPLVQEFSYKDLNNKKYAHMYAVKYYLSLPPPENPTTKEELQPAIEAHYHACEAEMYDLGATIIWQYKLDSLLDLWGNTITLIEMYEKLLPKNHLIDEPILKNRKFQGIIFGSLGSSYHNLGKPRKAIEYYEQSLKIAKEIKDKHTERSCLGNMGNVYSDLGELRKAIEYYEQVLKISKEIEDRHGECAYLGNMGNAYLYLGEPIKAIEYYEQGLKIARNIGNRRAEGNTLGNLGVAYGQLGKTSKSIEHHKQALQILKEIGDRRAEGANLGSLGSAYRKLGNPKKAIEYYEEGLTIAEEIGDKRGKGIWFGSLGNAYRDLGELGKTIKYYKEGLQIAKEIEDRHGECITLANIGVIYKDLGKTNTAIVLFKESLEIAKAIEYQKMINHCLQELEELEKVEDHKTLNETKDSSNFFKNIFDKIKSKK